MAKSLEALRRGQEFVSYAQRKGANVRNGKGSHCVVSNDKGAVVIPIHNGDLGKGLRCKIVKYFLAIGLAAVPFACVIMGLLS